MKGLIYILTFLAAILSVDATAQVDRREVRKGNRDFKKENYREADIEYRKALVKDSLSMAANYNLANTLYRQNDYEQAAKTLERIKEMAPASEYAADYYYNLGDVAIAAKNWQAAVDAFKQSLLRNPGDLEAKENYIYAKKMLENQQQQQQNQQNDQNQNNDQNNDQDQQNDQNQDQNQDQQDNKDQQDDQNQNDQNQQNDQQSGQQPKITPQAAQQMLQAIQAKEKETQEKVKKEKAKALNSRQKEKNW